MKEFRTAFSRKYFLLCIVLLQACQSVPVQHADQCVAGECRSCDVDCATPNNQTTDQLPPVQTESHAPQSTGPTVSNEPEQQSSPLLCDNAGRFKRKVVGNGHCVALIRACSSSPTTNHWQAGERVTKSSPQPGTVIATFLDGKYPSRKGYHAAIFISQDENGIWVWDQWRGKAVHKRLIKFGDKRSDASNSAQAYRIVMLDQRTSGNPN